MSNCTRASTIVPHVIGRRESLYLDLIRIIAAGLVVQYHASAIFGLASLNLGHQGVVIFFVLSGYVISHVADTRETTAKRFLIARLARLWSVLFPAMALTVACDFAGRTWGFHPDVYQWSPDDFPLIRIAAALSFLSQSWVDIQAFSNLAWWSLPLEFWYYMTFAAWTFAPSRRLRVVLVATAALMSGPKGLVLLPVWIMGVAAQRSKRLRQAPPPGQVLLCLGTLAALLWLLSSPVYDTSRQYMGDAAGPWVTARLAQAAAFPYDWVLGLTLAVHLTVIPALLRHVPIERLAPPIRWCAGISFATYLFHQPLLFLTRAFLPPDDAWLGVGLTMAVIAALGPAAEHTKYWWRRSLGAWWDRLAVHRAGGIVTPSG